MTIKRLGPGFYNIQHSGKSYDLDKYPDGAWLLFEVAAEDCGREFVNDFATKRDAVACLYRGAAQ